MKVVAIILLLAAGCASTKGSRCYSHDDCRAASLLCSNTPHGGAPGEPPPPPPSCRRDADCAGADARCVRGACALPGTCEQAIP